MHVIFLGPPGSGKGTQAKLLAERLQVPDIATGEMLRTAVLEGTPLGGKVKAVMESGDLVPDDLMIALIQERLVAPDAENGFVLDGFPRTVDQALALERILKGNEKGVDVVLSLAVPEAALIDRLAGRSGLENRTDDGRHTVLERLRVYHEKTEPLIDFYKKRGVLREVDGVGTVPEITERLGNALAQGRPARGVA